MHVELDLERPPAPLGPRVSRWVWLALGWGASVVFLIVTLSLESQPSAPGVDLVLLILSFVAIATMGYVQLRFRIATSAASQYLMATRPPFADVEDAPRTADPEEVAARHQLSQGRLDRAEYERIIAYRRFVHGELSREEYHARLAEIEAEKPLLGPRPRDRAGGSGTDR
jgi:hypothetical protein